MRKIDIGYWLGEAEQAIVGAWQWRKARTFADLRDMHIEDLDDELAATDDGSLPYRRQIETEIALTQAGMLTLVGSTGGINTAKRRVDPPICVS